MTIHDMTAPAFQVDVIIPTTGSPARAASIRRAVASIRAATSRPVRIIAVVNGGKEDPGIVDWLRQEPGVLVILDARPSLPHALLKGREAVSAPYFATLDDDDEYLPGALDRRIAALEQAPGAALVVTNGYRHARGRDDAYYNHLPRVATDPLSALFEANWLNSGNALYRTGMVTAADFADHYPYAEWTWLAFRLALRGAAIAVDHTPGFRIHDTPDSLSKSTAYFQAYLDLYDRMLSLRPPLAIRKLIHRRRSATWHDYSVKALQINRRADAWKCHLRCLALPGGLRYVSYTRRLLPGWPAA
jgi:glycosyltransferase involved in cell wall biosynthesis